VLAAITLCRIEVLTMRFLVLTALLALLAGCSERTISSSAREQTLIAAPPPAQQPAQAAPPTEEVRVTEPEPPPPPPPPPVEMAKESPPAAVPAPSFTPHLTDNQGEPSLSVT
jgi:hypothetical protein